MHVSKTLLTGALARFPVALDRTHVCVGEEGCVATVTEYWAPLASELEKLNAPFA